MSHNVGEMCLCNIYVYFGEMHGINVLISKAFIKNHEDVCDTQMGGLK